MKMKIEKRTIFFITFAISLFFLSYQRGLIAQGYSEYTTNSWFVYYIQNETDYNEDGTPDVITTFTPMNDTFLEIYVNRTAGGGYKWVSALCNVTGIENVGKWEYNPATDWWSYTGPLNYDKLTNYGLPEDWCNETNNYGFVLFSASGKDIRYRLNFTEGHKVIQIYTGKGSDLKEAWTTKYYHEAKKTYDYWGSWIMNRTQESYESGVELYLHDWNLNIEMMENGEVKVMYNVTTANETVINIYSWHKAIHRFICFEYPEAGSVNTVRCPENRTSVQEFAEEFAGAESENLVLDKKQGVYTYSLSYLLIDNQTGNLTFHEFTMNPSEKTCQEEGRKSPNNIFDFKEHDVNMEYNINFSYTGTSHCIKFPVPRYANLTLNVTMLSPIVNFTLPQDYVVYNYIQDNSLIAKIRPYPCCGIKNINLQSAEVCS